MRAAQRRLSGAYGIEAKLCIPTPAKRQLERARSGRLATRAFNRRTEDRVPVVEAQSDSVDGARQCDVGVTYHAVVC